MKWDTSHGLYIHVIYRLTHACLYILPGPCSWCSTSSATYRALRGFCQKNYRREQTGKTRVWMQGSRVWQRDGIYFFQRGSGCCWAANRDEIHFLWGPRCITLKFTPICFPNLHIHLIFDTKSNLYWFKWFNPRDNASSEATACRNYKTKPSLGLKCVR